MTPNDAFRPFEILSPADQERHTVFLIATTVRRKTKLWVLDRLQRNWRRPSTEGQSGAYRKSDIEIDLAESFVLAWHILRLGAGSIWAQSKWHFRIQRLRNWQQFRGLSNRRAKSI